MEPQGIFLNYDLEEIYYFIGTEKIEHLLKKEEGVARMGISVKEILLNNSFSPNVDTLGILSYLIDFFSDDLDINLFIYNFSKKFNESNYYDNQKSKLRLEKWKSMIDLMIERNPDDKEFWENRKLSNYWLEYHFFLIRVLDNLIYYDERRKKSILNLTGKYLLNEKLLIRENIILKINKRRKPGIGKYLLIKKHPIIKDIIFNLTPLNTEETNFSFEIENNGIYLIDINNNNYNIIKVTELNKICNYNILEIIEEIKSNYLKNIESISTRIYLDSNNSKTETPELLSNGVLHNLLYFYEENKSIKEEIVKINNNYSFIWNEIEDF